MVREAVRGYWALATGLTEVTRQKAASAAKMLVSQGEASADQVAAVADDLISTSRSNRAALVDVIRFEIDRARSAVGLANATDMEALRRRVQELEAAVDGLRRAAAGSRPAGSAKKAGAAKETGSPKKTAAATRATPAKSAALQKAAVPRKTPTAAKTTAAKTTRARR